MDRATEADPRQRLKSMRSFVVAAVALIALCGPIVAAESLPSRSATTSERMDGEDVSAKITPEQRAFGERMITAIQKKDLDELKTLIAPKALACFDQSRQEFLKVWLYK